MLNDRISPLCNICSKVIFSSPHVLSENMCRVSGTVSTNEWRLYDLASVEIWPKSQYLRNLRGVWTVHTALWKFEKQHWPPRASLLSLPAWLKQPTWLWNTHGSRSFVPWETLVVLEPLLFQRKHLEKVGTWGAGVPSPVTTFGVLSLVHHGRHTMTASPGMTVSSGCRNIREIDELSAQAPP